MYRVFCFRRLAVVVEGIDFLDPRLAGEPGARERGVRVELRTLVEAAGEGSIYASREVRLQRGICRFDLLESRPGAADRMHWHPAMSSGEPGERVFDPDLSRAPAGWLCDRLHDVTPLLVQAGLDPVEYTADIAALAEAAGEIVACVSQVLGEARRAPWPAVCRDARGLAPIR
ncbi:hypothetical protein [Saccharopolyspora thermophila]|uniref:Uncharacterized protein n=1 Tax=Saccharopolyspora thermophila TaxID=89367 RepID=A0ABP3MX80_9PSEU